MPPETITPPRPEAETPLVEVDTKEKLVSLVEELKKEPCIAIDLEHHNQHSYQGFTCLIQVSTRTTDYLVDVLVIREHVWLLNEVTSDPSIMKVLHGANQDILWLQKDFGVYVVNMFDTGQAARVLGFESFGLAYLLKRFCSVRANKEFQRSTRARTRTSCCTSATSCARSWRSSPASATWWARACGVTRSWRTCWT